MPIKPIKVFISYANEDSKIAENVFNWLVQNNFEPYLDKNDINAGDIKERVRKGIKSSNILVEILTRNSIGKTWVKQEIAIAETLGIPVLPIAFESIDYKNELEGLEEGKYVLPMYEDNISGSNKLLQILKKIEEKKNMQEVFVILTVGAMLLYLSSGGRK